MLPLLGVGKSFRTTVVLLKDTFTDTNGTDLRSHTMDIGPGWTVKNGTGASDNVFSIQSDQCQGTAGAVRAGWSNAGNANATVSASVGCDTGDPNAMAPGLAACVTDANNLWVGEILASGSIQIREVVSGSSTVRASASFTVANLTLYPCTLQVSGTTITLTVNNGTPISYGSMSSGGGVTNFGLNEGGNNNGRVRLWSNFQVTNP